LEEFLKISEFEKLSTNVRTQSTSSTKTTATQTHKGFLGEVASLKLIIIKFLKRN
jgi:hypothetical protein